jgi:hypothetical protein
MRRAWSLLLLVGALLLLASLYLPWEKASSSSGDPTGFLNLGLNPLSLDGWSSGIGPAAALSALLLAAVVAAAVARPNLSRRLPLGLCALFAGYFAVAVGAAVRSYAREREIEMKISHFHYAYGAYVRVSSAIVALLAAGAMRRAELVRSRSSSQRTVVVLVAGLLVSFLLPWQRFTVPPGRFTFLGIVSPAAVIAVVLALCLVAVSWRADAAAHAERAGLAAATALFTGAALSSHTDPGVRAYGAWSGSAPRLRSWRSRLRTALELRDSSYRRGQRSQHAGQRRCSSRACSFPGRARAMRRGEASGHTREPVSRRTAGHSPQALRRQLSR